MYVFLAKLHISCTTFCKFFTFYARVFVFVANSNESKFILKQKFGF